MNDNMQKALAGQVNHELYAAYLYLSAGGYFESQNLSGYARWMKHHAKEEISHAMKIFDYVYERGGNVELAQIKAPKKSWASPIEALSDAYQHEKMVSGLIDGLVDLARSENDKATEIFLHWFVTEQVEEEKITLDILEKTKLAGEHKQSILMLDRMAGEMAGKD